MANDNKHLPWYLRKTLDLTPSNSPLRRLVSGSNGARSGASTPVQQNGNGDKGNDLLGWFGSVRKRARQALDDDERLEKEYDDELEDHRRSREAGQEEDADTSKSFDQLGDILWKYHKNAREELALENSKKVQDEKKAMQDIKQDPVREEKRLFGKHESESDAIGSSDEEAEQSSIYHSAANDTPIAMKQPRTDHFLHEHEANHEGEELENFEQEQGDEDDEIGLTEENNGENGYNGYRYEGDAGDDEEEAEDEEEDEDEEGHFQDHPVPHAQSSQWVPMDVQPQQRQPQVQSQTQNIEPQPQQDDSDDEVIILDSDEEENAPAPAAQLANQSSPGNEEDVEQLESEDSFGSSDEEEYYQRAEAEQYVQPLSHHLPPPQDSQQHYPIPRQFSEQELDQQFEYERDAFGDEQHAYGDSRFDAATQQELLNFASEAMGNNVDPAMFHEFGSHDMQPQWNMVRNTHEAEVSESGSESETEAKPYSSFVSANELRREDDSGGGDEDDRGGHEVGRQALHDLNRRPPELEGFNRSPQVSKMENVDPELSGNVESLPNPQQQEVATTAPFEQPALGLTGKPSHPDLEELVRKNNAPVLELSSAKDVNPYYNDSQNLRRYQSMSKLASEKMHSLDINFTFGINKQHATPKSPEKPPSPAQQPDKTTPPRTFKPFSFKASSLPTRKDKPIAHPPVAFVGFSSQVLGKSERRGDDEGEEPATKKARVNESMENVEEEPICGQVQKGVEPRHELVEEHAEKVADDTTFHSVPQNLAADNDVVIEFGDNANAGIKESNGVEAKVEQHIPATETEPIEPKQNSDVNMQDAQSENNDNDMVLVESSGEEDNQEVEANVQDGVPSAGQDVQAADEDVQGVQLSPMERHAEPEGTHEQGLRLSQSGVDENGSQQVDEQVASFGDKMTEVAKEAFTEETAKQTEDPVSAGYGAEFQHKARREYDGDSSSDSDNEPISAGNLDQGSQGSNLFASEEAPPDESTTNSMKSAASGIGSQSRQGTALAGRTRSRTTKLAASESEPEGKITTATATTATRSSRRKKAFEPESSTLDESTTHSYDDNQPRSSTAGKKSSKQSSQRKSSRAEQQQPDDSNGDYQEHKSARAKRGRPRKNVAKQDGNSNVSDNEEDQKPVPRGRSKKAELESETGVSQDEAGNKHGAHRGRRAKSGQEPEGEQVSEASEKLTAKSKPKVRAAQLAATEDEPVRGSTPVAARTRSHIPAESEDKRDESKGSDEDPAASKGRTTRKHANSGKAGASKANSNTEGKSEWSLRENRGKSGKTSNKRKLQESEREEEEEEIGRGEEEGEVKGKGKEEGAKRPKTGSAAKRGNSNAPSKPKRGGKRKVNLNRK